MQYRGDAGSMCFIYFKMDCSDNNSVLELLKALLHIILLDSFNRSVIQVQQVLFFFFLTDEDIDSQDSLVISMIQISNQEIDWNKSPLGKSHPVCSYYCSM